MVGLWVYVSVDDDRYATGEIVREWPESTLVRFLDDPSGAETMRLFEKSGLLAETGSVFFETREELDKFVSWLHSEKEEGPHVVSIRKET